jgi:hypothetical protein
MTKSLVLGAILGGLAAFLWSNVSWEILPWHERTLLAFQDEDAVGQAIAEHASNSGVYLFPAGPKQAGMTKEQKKAAEAVTWDKMQKGPIVFAAVRREGFTSAAFTRSIVCQFAIQVIAAFLLTWMLLKTSEPAYWSRVGFLTLAGLAAGVISDLPNWNWWGFSGSYTTAAVTDSALTWFVAGLVIAGVARSQPKSS